MRVAVCISGQMRTFRKVAQSLVAHLVRPLNADIFIHTWDVTGNTNKLILSLPRGFHLKMPGEYWHDNPDVFNDSACPFAQVFPNLYAAMQEETGTSQAVTREELFDLYSPKLCEVEPFNAQFFEDVLSLHAVRHLVPDGTMFNAAPMFYKIWACDLLRQNYEESKGLKYDAVIRVRPDMLFFEDVRPEDIEPNGKLKTLYNPFYDIIGRPDLSNDMLFVGDSVTMSYASNLWNKLGKFWDPAQFSDWAFATRGPEKILKYYLSEAGLGDDVLKMEPSPQRVVAMQVSFEEMVSLLKQDLLRNGNLPDFARECVAACQSIHAWEIYSAGRHEEALELLTKPISIDGYLCAEPIAGRAKIAVATHEPNAGELVSLAKAAGQESIFPEIFA